MRLYIAENGWHTRFTGGDKGSVEEAHRLHERGKLTDAWLKRHNLRRFDVVHLYLMPVDEKGWVVYDWPSTRVRRNGTNRMAGIILAMTGQPAQARNTAELVREFHQRLIGNRTVKIETVWEASCAHDNLDGKRQVIRRGQTNFPPLLDKSGQMIGYNPGIECPRCGATVWARARIIKYVHDPEAPATVDQSTVLDPLDIWPPSAGPGY